MKRLALAVGLAGLLGCGGPNPRVLLFSRTAAFRQQSIPVAQTAIMTLGREHRFRVDTTEDVRFKRLVPDLNVLLSIDETSYQGGTNGAGHPMTWYHAFDGGRAWYTALGHTDESYADPNFLTLLTNGIRWAVEGPALDYRKAIAVRVPSDPGLVKTVLSQGQFTEPTEMAVLPNGDVMVVERRGRVLRYRAADRSLTVMGQIPVYWQSGVNGVNAEEGLLGVTADPGFAENRYLYLFYSPVGPSVNRLARFTLTDDSLALGSEKVVLEFFSQRKICCHTGGSLAFGPEGNLYLSTGDNSTPFDVPGQRIANHGFAPLDNRPGREPYDARRSSANSNDLRGKIVRIRISPDGSSTIPPGNLFPPGTPNTRPEIFAMGTRNAYRLSGPVFRAERYPGGGALPPYYDGKLIIYDWIRNWIKAVTLTDAGDYEAMEPFLPGVKFAAPIDVELGPDGSLYVLEYGIGWFKQNSDAGLSRIAAVGSPKLPQ